MKDENFDPLEALHQASEPPERIKPGWPLDGTEPDFVETYNFRDCLDDSRHQVPLLTWPLVAVDRNSRS